MSAEQVGRRRLSYGRAWFQAVQLVGLAAGIVAAFLLPNPVAWARLAPLVTIVAVTAVIWTAGYLVLEAREKAHDLALEQVWERTAREQAWQFDRDYRPVGTGTRELLLGRDRGHLTEGTPYRLDGMHRGRAMAVQIWLIGEHRLSVWRQLPERRTIMVVQSTMPLPVIGFGTGGLGMRMIERGSQLLKGATFGTHRSGHWVAAGEPDDMPVAMEVLEPFLADLIKPGRILRVVADGDRVGLMINQEKEIEEIFAWLDTMDQIATTLEGAVRDGTLVGPQP